MSEQAGAGLIDDEREALHEFMHNGWRCQYASIDTCRRFLEFEARFLQARNLRTLKHEAETPTREHDENGLCCFHPATGVSDA